MIIGAREWPTVPLNEVVELTLSSVDKKAQPDEEIIRLCNYMDVYSNSFISASLDFMHATATEHEIAKCTLLPGDVVITKDSEKHDDIGVPALVREDIPPLICGYHLAILRPNSSTVDGTYLFYALSDAGTQKQFHSYANGITRFGLRKTDIGLVEIPLPPMPEQQRIAGILATLDEKIELNRKMNEILQQIARALFKSWFVDFDPVFAKMRGQWRSGESLPGLPADIFDLFPDHLSTRDSGTIPDGWENRRIGDLAELNPESWTSTNIPAQVEYIDLAHTKWGVIESTQHFAWEEAPSRAKRVLRTHDTIVGTVRPGNGSYALIGREGFTGSTGFAVLRPISPHFRELTYLAATRPDNILRLSLRADGAAYPAVRPEVVAETAIAMPAHGHELPKVFSTISGPLLDKAQALNDETTNLAIQRDTLLPELMSGKIQSIPRLP